MSADVYAVVAEAIIDASDSGYMDADEHWFHVARAAVDALAGMGDPTAEQIQVALHPPCNDCDDYGAGSGCVCPSWDDEIGIVRALIAQARATDQARIAEDRIKCATAVLDGQIKLSNTEARAEAAEAEVARHRDDTAAYIRERGTVIWNEMAAEVTALRATVERLRELVFASDDGSEYEHIPDCEGIAECPACWAVAIDAALASSEGDA
jgi:hypothetical protein